MKINIDNSLNYREENNSSNIFLFFADQYAINHAFLIWQKGERLTTKTTLVYIDENELVFKLPGNRTSSLNPEVDIYITSTQFEFAARTQINQITHPFLLHCKIPDVIRKKEMRTTPRITSKNMLQVPEVYAKITSSNKAFHHVRLIDFSEKGLGLSVPKKYCSGLIEKDRISITCDDLSAIGGLYTVVFLKSINYESVRLGLKK